MWLINTETLKLESFLGEAPPYAILSHTWGPGEVTFSDFHSQHNKSIDKTAGFPKIKLTCEQARTEGIRYAWVDTCCINKESSAELSEAINSMFKWYKLATVCYAYLDDFSQDEESSPCAVLLRCRWFSRGWTLQELLAPKHLVFFVPQGNSWRGIGGKSSWVRTLEQITRIPGEILLKQKPMETVSVAARMSWAARRQTTREEDLAYCLMGIFNVNMPLLYGEGQKAFIRLQEEIMRETGDDSLFAWCSTKETAVEAPYRGLFACSPKEFLDGADIEHFDIDEGGAGSTTSMLGQGRVSLSCQVHHEDSGRVILALKCFRGDLSNIQGIECVCIGDNFYLRSEPSRLFRCSIGPRKNVTIHKYALETEANEYVYDRVRWGDSICLTSLPNGVHLKAVLSEGAGNSLGSVGARKYLRQNLPTNSLVPVSWVIGRKMAFEIGVEIVERGWAPTEHRLLILFWVDTVPGSRSYTCHFNLEKSDCTAYGEANVTFENAIKPAQPYRNCELDIGRKYGRKGRYVVRVEKTHKTLNGNQRLEFDLSIKANPKRRTDTTVRSRYDVDEAATEHRRTLNSPRGKKLTGLLSKSLHVIAVLLLIFSFLTRNFKLALLVAFLWVMVIMLIWGSERGTVAFVDPEQSPLL